MCSHVKIMFYFLYCVQTIFPQKFLVNFTYNEKETASNTEINMKSIKTEILFSCKTL